tara:strand:+ start:1168 stop:3795 length:2628 start_codon:yes stop_codon:yes gene_type:complete
MSNRQLLTENEIKEIIREEFASQGVILTEEQLEELFGMFGRSKLVKQIKEIDPEGEELEKLGYTMEKIEDLDKGALQQILDDLREATGTEAPKGFMQKVKDVYAGVKDIGILSGGAGTLLGGEETFDIEKRNQLKGDAKKQIEGWLGKLKYDPLTSMYSSLNQAQFPNNKGGEFKANAAELQQEYDKVVKDFENGQLDVDRANTIIAVLRALVIYYQDFAMSDKNFYVNEEVVPDEGGGEEEQEPMGAKQGSTSKNFIAAYGNQLPLGLAAAGVACLAAGFAADSDFFQNFLQGFKDMETIPTEADQLRSITNVLQLGEVKPGEGIIRVVRRMTPLENFGKAGGPGLGELAKYPMVVKLLGASLMSKGGPGALQDAISQNLDPLQTFGQAGRTGTAKAGEELFGLNKGVFEKNATKVINEKLKGTKSIPAATLKNKFLTGLGSLLGPILKALGLGALVAALASFGMRQKGKGKMGGSRMSMLKNMVDGFLDVEGEGGEKPPPPPPPPRPPGGGDTYITQTTNIDIDVLVNLIQQLTQITSNNTTVNNVNNIINNIDDRDTEINVDQRQFMQDIVNILIQNNIDINNTNINTNIVNQLVPVLIKTGDISTPEEKSRIKPVLIRYDKDDIKLYSPRILNPEMSKEYIELFSKVESNGLVGDDRITAEVSEMLQRMVSTGILLELSPLPPEEERPPGDDTPPPDEGGADEEGAPEKGGKEVETDVLERAMEGSRGVRWDEDNPKLGPLTMARLKKRWPNRKSRNRRTGVITRTVMKFYYVFDKTLVTLDEEIGVDAATTQALAKLVINKLKKSKRVKLDTADLQKLVARAAKKSGELQGKEDQVIDALAQMHVVSDSGQRELAEGKTLSRWKVLSGIR